MKQRLKNNKDIHKTKSRLFEKIKKKKDKILASLKNRQKVPK